MLDRALAAAEFQGVGFGVAPVLVDLGEEFGGLGQGAGELAESLDLVAQDVVAEALAIQPVGWRELPRLRPAPQDRDFPRAHQRPGQARRTLPRDLPGLGRHRILLPETRPRRVRGLASRSLTNVRRKQMATDEHG